MKMSIKELRVQKGLTQAELADAIGISSITLKRYEYGKRLPDVRTAIRIAKALGTDVTNLWDGNPTKQATFPL